MLDDISRNAEGFARSLMAMADYVDGSVEKVIRKACIDLYRRIATRTPVETGRARASWSLTTADTDEVAEDKKYSEQELVGIINSKSAGFSAEISDGVVWITNNLDYIEYLENGSSSLAPNGMVAVSLADFENHFNSALKGLEGLVPA